MAEILNIPRWKVYEDVWSQPMYKICENYGMSDNGLRKVCKKHNIPIPGTGYWNRALAGNKQSKPILKGNVGYCIRFIKKSDFKNEKSNKDKTIRELINSIQFNSALEEPLPFTKKYLATIRKNKKHKDKFLTLGRFAVSKENIQRATIIVNNLANTINLLGGKISIEEKGLIISIWDYSIEIGVSEKVDSYIPEKPVKRQMYCYDQYEYRGSNKFTIHLGWSPYWSPFDRATFNDGKKQRIEDLLPKIFTEIYQYTLKQNHAKLQSHYESMRKRRSERIKQVVDVVIQEKEYKKDKLQKQIANWRKANEMRVFAHDLMIMAKKNPQNIKSIKEFNDWIRFIIKEADVIIRSL